MFFFFPFGGGGFFGLIFFLMILRLILRLIGFRNNDSNSYNDFGNFRYYEFHTQTPGSDYQKRNTPSKAYTTLGVAESASDEEIKRAYRKLTLEYHPDTIAGKGLGPEFTEFASSKFREVQQAYEEICKERNMK